MNTFADVITRWARTEDFASDLGVPLPTAYAWRWRQSIPAARFAAVVAAAKKRGFRDITVGLLADLAERRRATPPDRAARSTADVAA